MKRMTASAAFIEPRETVIPWGVASSIDIYDCDAETIRDADKIRRFVAELCDLIEMKNLVIPLSYTLEKMNACQDIQWFSLLRHH